MFLLYLVSSEGESVGFDAGLRDDVELNGVSGVNVALGGRDEHVFHQFHRLLLRQWKFLNVLHVFVSDLKRGHLKFD